MARPRGGDKLQIKLKAIADKLARGKAVRVGFFENATYPNGTPVAMVAAIQELGAPKAGVPARPYFRPMISAHKAEWGDTVGKLLVANEFDSARTLAQMGEGIKGQLQEAIIDVIGPPLSPVTLMLRKMRSENPDLVVTAKTVGEAARRVAAGESTAGAPTKMLVDSGHLLNSADYEVET